MRRIISLLSLSLLASLTALAQDPTKADAQHYKVEFENDKVRVLRVKVEPRGKTPTHSHPDAGVEPRGGEHDRQAVRGRSRGAEVPGLGLGPRSRGRRGGAHAVGARVG